MLSKTFIVAIPSSLAGLRFIPRSSKKIVSLEITGADPKETIFLDDLGINLKPARELGMATIKVLDSNQALKELTDLTGINFE